MIQAGHNHAIDMISLFIRNACFLIYHDAVQMLRQYIIYASHVSRHILILQIVNCLIVSVLFCVEMTVDGLKLRSVRDISILNKVFSKIGSA